MSLKIKKIDIILTAVILFLASLSLALLLVYSKPDAAAKVYVYIDSKLVHGAPYDLKNDISLTYHKNQYPALLADLTVEIKDKKVAVTYEESPRNYCSNQGFIGLANFPIVCMPNKTLVIIKSGTGYVI